MKKIWILARMTFREAIRRRIVLTSLVLGILFLVVLGSVRAVREFRPYFDNAPVYGHGPSLEDFSTMTPLTVGTPAPT